MQETVAILRKLAQANPTEFLPKLAGNLNDLGIVYSVMGQREAAIGFIQESLDIIWPLFLASPSVFWRETAMVLDRLRALLHEASRPYPEELKERVRIFESLPESK
jgi:tetratricopeptide (TPR) repeat protein